MERISVYIIIRGNFFIMSQWEVILNILFINDQLIGMRI